MMQAIRNRIRRKGRGWVFTPADFLNVGSRASVDQSLSRLVGQGFIRRLDRGVYDYPKVSSRLGALSPSPDAVAHALARQDGSNVQLSPARAANMFGLTTQVPAKAVYLTDGSSRTRSIGRQTVVLKSASPKMMVGAGTKAGAVLQALRYVGKDGVDDHVIARLDRSLDDHDRHDLGRVAPRVQAWLRPHAQKLSCSA